MLGRAGALDSKFGLAFQTLGPSPVTSGHRVGHFGVAEANWREGGKKDPSFLESESPLLVGRAVAALAADPNVMERSGDVTSSWELARQYDVVDADGRRPDPEVLWDTIASSFPGFQESFRREMRWLDRLARRAERYAGGASPARAKSKGSAKGR